MVGKKGKGKGKGVNFKAKRPEVDHRSAGSSSHDSDKYIQQSNSRKRIVVGKKNKESCFSLCALLLANYCITKELLSFDIDNFAHLLNTFNPAIAFSFKLKS